MTKLMDIKGYWDMSNRYNFNDLDMWEGQILLHDDGWFEGIAVDPNSCYYGGDRFIFGVYYPEKIVELFKFAPLDVSKPFIFHGRRDAKGYVGKLETIELFGTIPCGNCFITTQYAETVRQGIDEETKKLEDKIQIYKDTTMDEVSKDFYDNAFAMREILTMSTLRSYEGKEFTLEEKEELRQKYESVNASVINAMEQGVIKLVKQLPKEYEEKSPS